MLKAIGAICVIAGETVDSTCDCVHAGCAVDISDTRSLLSFPIRLSARYLTRKFGLSLFNLSLFAVGILSLPAMSNGVKNSQFLLLALNPFKIAETSSPIGELI